MTDRMALSDVRPGQLYLNAAKLAAVLERVDSPGHEFGPLPVYEFDGDMYLTDGHTRGFAAYLRGADSVAVEYDEELAEEHSVAVYRECISWCEDADVERIRDLAGRVLPPDTYEKKWIERCHRAAERLE